MLYAAIPASATHYGFIADGLGAHSSRTIMLAELRLLLATCAPNTDYEGYVEAILVDNVLLKRTDATRRESVRRLRELYGLANEVVVFRALKDLWLDEPDAQPMLALLCALARDPVLRATAPLVLEATTGEVVTPSSISSAVAKSFPAKLNATTLANIGRNAASSWTQSGHLHGRTNKVRVAARSHPASTTYALFLGYLCGGRGEALFQTAWSRMLDTSLESLHEQAFSASQRGWLEYRHAGAVTEVGFSHLLRKEAGTDE